MSTHNLRSQVIRLAHQHPEFRQRLLPLVTAAEPRMPVAQKREVVRGWLEAEGLKSLGTRSGKGGEFYAAPGVSPTRVIALGNRDLLLNIYQIGKNQDPNSRFEERWILHRPELLSAVTEDLVKKWAAWVKKGIDRKALRQQVVEELMQTGEDYAVALGSTNKVASGIRPKRARAELVSVSPGQGQVFLEADDIDQLFDTLKQEGLRPQVHGDRVVVPLTRSISYSAIVGVLEDVGYQVD